MTFEWKPWAVAGDGPPCKHCQHWKPQFKYFPDGTSDGVRLCHAEQQYQDFSCFRLRCSSTRVAAK